MSNYSTLGKWFAALIFAGGGVAGAWLGISGSKKDNERKVVDYLTSSQNKVDYSEPTEEQSINSSNELTEGKDSNRPEAREEKTQASIEEANHATLSDQGTKSSITIAEPAKEITSPEQKNDLEKKIPNSSSENINPKNQSPDSKEIVAESLTVRKEDSSNKNWFSINLSDIDVFDSREWPANECPKEVDGEKVVFKCNWDEGSSTVIDLHLSLSSDPELKGKKWEDVEELHFTSRGESLATLGLVFSDRRDREIFLSLQSASK